jgi:spore coat protein A
MKSKKPLTILTMALLSLIIVLPIVEYVFAVPPTPFLLNPNVIPKYTNQLSDASGNPLPPPVYVPEFSNATHEFYTVNVTEFNQQILPTIDALGNPTGFGTTTVWGYGGNTTLGYVRNAPGPTFEATQGKEIYVRYQNKLSGVSHLFAVDPTLHWANPNNIPMMEVINNATAVPSLAPPYPPGYNGAPYLDPITGVLTNPAGWNAQAPVPIIPHLHGGEVQSTSDGHPEAWFTPGSGVYPQGSAYNTELTNWVNASTGVFDIPVQTSEAVFRYPNDQPPTTLWYHDHALGITRINVMSGLAGFYMLRNDTDTTARSSYIPPYEYEMPLVIQDRTFDINGQFYFPSVGLNPEHPYWLPEFFGDTIMVNGLVWPNMNVKQGVYRLRLLDGSNARFYTVSFWIPNATLLGIPNKLPFTIIGSDGGYLPAPVTVKELTIAPGERWDILVDFSAVPYVPGVSNIILRNTAEAPFKGGGGGTPANPQTVGQIMKFTVLGAPGWTGQPVPAQLNTIPTLPAPTTSRQLTLLEVMGPGGPLEVLLDGKKWGADISENVTLGDTEEWIIVNPTADAHPIHLHLVQFQLVSRQNFRVNKYVTDWMALNGMPPVPNDWITQNPPYQNYLQGKIAGPRLHETGWKDTIQAFPGQVTIIRVRFAPIGGGTYPFDATQGPGYVWHCHILDHEDNEMMRPYLVKLPPPP